ncbi:LysR substrate-binding domain-containing protein (plasmid) [Mesorhizobium mediterraneum]|uniref:HTH lysR-type domain-containing protein n=4 Tax=Mesorhizobium TaxID=68287 RepID=A0AB36RHZ3_9HYPH|nr:MULTISPECIES: LysR substrate-binding domain-containing protein [Mesorhizobium]PAQ04329.1 hypothetical protein CIT25_00385 [Mesorhizobium mediterraneum]RWA99527.1 MAG: LysR family transcriptional regulator [Mesorhizobium sp.]RWB10606.1 MAG: LysR family transcriptional regulator [Mesorhizobium sp.]RWN24412.1 MAG: LysR family transcriptional regulator [Mesorhizobium sp.]RWN27339.1 MAG: LysR family transcriptional regulator [Mesorhizobium sp.]
MRKLPNLNATRAFEAAARHGSFAAAADELGVSHAAVSRHVRNLEMELGVELFERHARHVVLTGEGSLFARTVARSFADLALGVGRLKRGTAKGTVVLDVETDLAVVWLMPRLTAQALDALRLNVDLRCRPDPPRSLPGDVDLVLTWGPAALIGFRSEPFLDLNAFPVASPALIAKGPDPVSPGFYAAHRLIHERGLYWWRRYCEAAGVMLDDVDNHLFFNRTHLCIDAALRGLGIAIGDHLSCGQHLRSGRLVQLPGPVLPGREQYHLLTPDTAHLSRPARQMRDWLRKAAKN